MGWQFFATAHILLSVVDALLQRSAAKLPGLNYRSKASLVHLLGIFPMGLGWAIIKGNVDLGFALIGWVLAAFVGLFIALGSLAVWKAAETVDAANLNIIIMLRAVVIAIIAAIFLSEKMTLLQIAGAALIILAGFIASHADGKEKSLNRKGVLLAALGAVLFGIALTLEKATLDLMTYETYLVVGFGFQALVLFIFGAKSLRDDGAKKIRKFVPRLTLLGVLVGASGMLYLAAVTQSDNVPLVASFINLKVVGVVIGGYIFLNEKGGLKHKIAGAALALLGFILLVI